MGWKAECHSLGHKGEMKGLCFFLSFSGLEGRVP